MEEEYEDLVNAIDDLEAKVESGDHEDDIEEQYYKVQEQFQEFEAEDYEERDLTPLKNRLNVLSKELNIYDPEAELDRMFPDRNKHDDYDDEVSGESFFKD